MFILFVNLICKSLYICNAYLLNVEPSNYHNIYRSSSSSLAMWRYSIEPKTRKYVKGYGFLSFARKYEKQ